MKPVTVDTQSLTTIAGSHGSAAATITERAVAERFDAALLAPTFGVIGAPFLATLSATMSSRASRLDTLASGHAGQAAATAAGAAGYAAADVANATGVRS
ncbi:MAG: type VII secretion target [Gordonia sp. (in: high G+C Gram-positive bacteria)]|uniref:type VII secretion target n=1 Tax=Gordonia sp. (in: high G+C Gram-positive bacteria) TaxID=84139 RepID=UPI0039E36AA8